MAANGYAPTSTQQVVATVAAQSVAISGTTLRIINLGPDVAYIALGSSQPVAVTPQTGLAIKPGGPPEFITVGANTFMGYITDRAYARLNVSQGT
jgi:hypothetical protein